jgi:hypothetical protein
MHYETFIAVESVHGLDIAFQKTVIIAVRKGTKRILAFKSVTKKGCSRLSHPAGAPCPAHKKTRQRRVFHKTVLEQKWTKMGVLPIRLVKY